MTCLYILLFAATFLGSFIVIPAEYMQTQLKHPINWAAYAQLAWLASSMGITAGALGSSFETDQAVREATYGKREQERHSIITGEEGANLDSESARKADEESDTNQGTRPDRDSDSKEGSASGSDSKEDSQR